ncbi:MAG: ferrochelatase [Kangiellaceae bacterium]|jgi:ferrochelatase
MTNKAVLLANLGSPDDCKEQPVREYLNQFLMDPYVIQLPWLLRRLIVSLFVLPKRPKDSAKAYAKVWTDEGSPLVVFSQHQQALLQQQTDAPVHLAMRYGNPSIESQLLEIANNDDIDTVLFIPLYPHYADSTVTTSIKEAERIIAKHQLKLTLEVKQVFYNEPKYIDALLQSSESFIQPLQSQASNQPHLLFSYHGLPELHLTKADPTGSHCLKVKNCCSTPSKAHATCYRHQVLETTRLFAEKAGLSPSQYTICFQSRLGRAKWLEPSTEDTLIKLAKQGIKDVLVICPAFVTDCLETLEEIAMEGEQTFVEAGGDSLKLIPCLNEHPAWIETMASWVKE